MEKASPHQEHDVEVHDVGEKTVRFIQPESASSEDNIGHARHQSPNRVPAWGKPGERVIVSSPFILNLNTPSHLCLLFYRQWLISILEELGNASPPPKVHYTVKKKKSQKEGKPAGKKAAA
jgi:hypothetical protein